MPESPLDPLCVQHNFTGLIGATLGGCAFALHLLVKNKAAENQTESSAQHFLFLPFFDTVPEAKSQLSNWAFRLRDWVTSANAAVIPDSTEFNAGLNATTSIRHAVAYVPNIISIEAGTISSISISETKPIPIRSAWLERFRPTFVKDLESHTNLAYLTKYIVPALSFGATVSLLITLKGLYNSFITSNFYQSHWRRFRQRCRAFQPDESIFHNSGMLDAAIRDCRLPLVPMPPNDDSLPLLCRVCCKHKADQCLLPCTHVIACAACVPFVHICPYCLTDVANTIHAFVV